MTTLRPLHQNVLYTLLVLSTTGLLVGCKIVPIQTTRVVQIESYSQTFEFDSVAVAQRIIPQVIGEKNYESIFYQYSSIAEEIIAGKLRSEGSFLFSISLLPEDHDMFFTEGFGRFFLIYSNDNLESSEPVDEILYTGDFRILPEIREIGDLVDKGVVPVTFQQYPVRSYPVTDNMEEDEKRAYLQGSNLCAIMKMDTSRKGQGIYSVDYSYQEHKVYVSDGNECGSDPGLFLGHISFGYPDVNKHKLIDMRGMKYVRKYKPKE